MNDTQTYVGQTGGTFKTRYNNHTSNFRLNKKNTTLATHVKKLNEMNTEYNIDWKLLAKIPSYQAGNRSCKLCTAEVETIIFKSEISSPNKRSELFNPCLHRAKIKLNKVK